MCLTSQVGPNELQCNDAVDEYVPCSINDTHPAFAEQRLQSISTGNHLPKKWIF
jgi:hypothetical protein